MITKLNKQRIQILSSKGHDAKSISERTGLSQKAVRMVTEPKIINLIGKKKPVRPHETKVMNRPKSKHKLVREYIENTDTVYSDDMNKLGVAHITTSLKHYAKHNNVRFEQLNHYSWAIIR